VLSDRRNIVVIADEAHRSQYDFIDGFARHMRDALPHASFIGFTGTPIELADANTRAVFGDYISIYDIQRAVEDGATVPIYYESRLAKLDLPEELKPRLDAEFEEVTEGMVTPQTSRRRRRRRCWSRQPCFLWSGQWHERGLEQRHAADGVSPPLNWSVRYPGYFHAVKEYRTRSRR
jgi:type I restriction enzyme R subunit